MDNVTPPYQLRATTPRFGTVLPTVNIAEMLRMLWRRRNFLLLCMLVAGVVAWVAVSRITPIYSASVKVLIDSRTPKYSDIQQFLISRVPTFMAVASEVEVIRSRELAKRVADSLNLTQDPEFNPLLRPQDSSGLFGWLRNLRAALLGAEDEKAESEADRQRRIERIVVDGVLGRLSAAPVPQSAVITISFRSENPAKAAKLANAAAEHYVTAQLEAKFDAIRRGTTWLNDRLETLRMAVARSEEALADYRRSAGLIDSGGRLPSQQNLTELNSQLIVTQGRRSEQQARVARIEALLGAGRGLEAVGEVLDSPLIQRLKEQEAILAREVSNLTLRYGERHPQMAKVRAEQVELQAKIDIEVGKLAQGLRNELGVLRDREANLKAQVAQLEGTILGQNEAQIRLHELEREAQANRTVYEAFLSRFKESGDQENIQQSDARIISQAEQPRGPAYPRRQLMLAAAVMLGLLAGVVILLVSEQLSRTVRNREQLERISGVPVLGQIPNVRSLPGRPVSNHLIDKPHSAFAEAFRMTWFALKHADPDSEPRVVLVTSAVPEEGKSLTSLSLARTAANLGLRVALVDADLRRPSLARTLGMVPTHGVHDVLSGKSTLEQALIKDPLSPIDLLLGVAGNAEMGLDLAGSKAMAALIADLRDRYDLVVFDSAPTLPVADTQVLGRLVDRTIFCVRWDKTPHDSVTLALRMLGDAHIQITGTLLTRVVLRRYAKYGYGDMGYHYGKYRGYYTN